ncbi:helix-turn-helix domain-containing protein [Paraburkholderia acidicola]|uniref:Helix-turn-helix domain-containing protein n=1 Tax=Paraburkholderia acidicola TaxID=1912599 RepID=A0ABV1LUL0_9BURK
MTYEEFIAKALGDRSVNRAAKELGIGQRSLDRYVKGERLPDYRTALILAREAGTSPGETMMILAREEERKHPEKDILSTGFRLLVDAWNRLTNGIKPAY